MRAKRYVPIYNLPKVKPTLWLQSDVVDPTEIKQSSMLIYKTSRYQSKMLDFYMSRQDPTTIKQKRYRLLYKPFQQPRPYDKQAKY